MSAIRNALRAAASPLGHSAEAGVRQRQYVFDADSAVFAGHFPEYPVLPGVVQILMAQMTLEEALGEPLSLAAIPRARFTAPLEPGAVVELEVRQGRRPGLWECSLHCAGRLASSFTIATSPENL